MNDQSTDERASPGLVEPLIRWAGTVVGVWGGVLLASYGAFFTPFRVGVALVPVSVVLALLGNALLAWFTQRVTRSRVLGLLPGAVWVIMTFLWSQRSTEGDIVLASTWVSSLYLLLGITPTVVLAYRWFVVAPLDRTGVQTRTSAGR